MEIVDTGASRFYQSSLLVAVEVVVFRAKASEQVFYAVERLHSPICGEFVTSIGIMEHRIVLLGISKGISPSPKQVGQRFLAKTRLLNRRSLFKDILVHLMGKERLLQPLAT